MYLGIDFGSRFVKLAYTSTCARSKVIFEQYNAIEFYQRYCTRRKGKLCFDVARVHPLFRRAKRIVATGYGKHIAAMDGIERITEIEAHVRGALHVTKHTTFTLLDIGGQDTKVVDVKDGMIVDFVMNEKCAAGSGRYLENMARVLDIDIQTMGNYYRTPVVLSNTCAIFGESEIIAHIVEGTSRAALASGVNYSVFLRVKDDIEHFGNRTVVFVGGVAQNKAIVHFLEQMKHTVIVPKYASFMGALGCLKRITQAKMKMNLSRSLSVAELSN